MLMRGNNECKKRGLENKKMATSGALSGWGVGEERIKALCEGKRTKMKSKE